MYSYTYFKNAIIHIQESISCDCFSSIPPLSCRIFQAFCSATNLVVDIPTGSQDTSDLLGLSPD